MAKQCNICGEYADIEKDCPQCGYICGKCSEDCDYEIKEVTNQQIEKLREENARLRQELQDMEHNLNGWVIENESLQAQLDAANLALAGARECIETVQRITKQESDILQESKDEGALEETVPYVYQQQLGLVNFMERTLSTLPTPANAPDLTRIAACVKVSSKVSRKRTPTYWDLHDLKEACKALTPEDLAWVERVGGV